MPPAPLLAFLQSTGHLDARAAAEVAAEFAPKSLSRRAFWLQAGHVNNDYWLLESGVLRAFALGADGREVTTAFYTPGQVVLEVASFFTRTPSLESVQALTDCAGWSLGFEQMNALFHARPAFREFGRAVLVRNFAALKARMLAAITEPAAARYAALLCHRPDVLRHAPLKHVASYLGVTDSSLSRLRKGGVGA